MWVNISICFCACVCHPRTRCPWTAPRRRWSGCRSRWSYLSPRSPRVGRARGWPAPWSGWCMLLQCFNKRDLKALLKGAYRKTGNEILKIARQRLMSSGIAHASKLKKGIRLRVYPRGGGFMITVKPHGKQGYHVNRFGLEKPVVMWAEEGTKFRFPRKGAFVTKTDKGFIRITRMGKMPAYHFLDDVERYAPPIIEEDIGKALEDSVMKRASRLGLL